jgi:endonuclease YncB( thermonuclease family)
VGRLIAILALLPSVALAQPTIIDGDTIKFSGKTVRLWGIDAPELSQTCPDGWPAGRMALTRLLEITNGKTIVCQDRDRDRYGRVVAVCWAAGIDLGEWMVRNGYAWSFTRYSKIYGPGEDAAKADRLGIHAHGCQPAWEWRAQKR